MQRIACVVLGLMVAAPAFGQSSPMPEEVQKAYAGIKANILKSADKMPAEDFSYKPHA